MQNARNKRNKGQIRPFPMLAAMASAVFCLYVFYGHGAFLARTGEEAAMLSAAINMPDSGLDVLKDRFRSSLFELPPPRQGDEQRQAAQDWPPRGALQKVEDKISDESVGESAVPGDFSGADEGRMPIIPDEYAGPVISENLAGQDGVSLIPYGSGYIKNDTQIPDSDVNKILETPYPIKFEDTTDPQVLIVHTHTTESYEKYDRDIYDTRNTWRSTDNSGNMAAVGDAMLEVLEENGIAAIHDTTQHDYPSYNGSYERSAGTVKSYLEQYPSIKVVLDLHRDAMQRDDAIIKPVAVIDGKKAAQIMIIAACDDGTMDVPEWRENLRFAAAFQDEMEKYYPNLTKPVFFCYRKYNMDLTTGSLLLEFGSNANTLDEAIYSARMAGQALSKLIWDNIQSEE